jgi:hypothetical protein
VRGEVNRMFIGKRYKLNAPAGAIETIDGRPVSITIPAGGTIEVVAVSSAESDMFVDVLLQGRMLAMYATDVDLHAKEFAD